MVKKQSIWFPGAIYYVTCFDAWNERMFDDEPDYIKYLSLLESIRYQYPFYLHSYCLITNEIHLLLETTHVPLKDVISTVNEEYAQYFKKKHGKFLPQFHSTLIDSVDSFLRASKMIHLAPLQEQLPLKNYRWSSYQAFISYVQNDHVVTSGILTYFKHPKMVSYCNFVEGEDNEAKICG